MMDGCGVIIVAGGVGTRMGDVIPKQFIPLGRERKPVLVHTLERFIAAVPSARIVIALPPQEFERWDEICSRFGLQGTHKMCRGGRTRFDSVRNAIAGLGPCAVVAVHDGVRPLASVGLIRRLFACAAEHGSAVPVIRPVDSFREMAAAEFSAAEFADAEDSAPVSIATRRIGREGLLAVQTPQVFDFRLLEQAYHTPYDAGFTDDASIVEFSGATLTFLPGERGNIKITTPPDIIMAEALLDNGY